MSVFVYVPEFKKNSILSEKLLIEKHPHVWKAHTKSYPIQTDKTVINRAKLKVSWEAVNGFFAEGHFAVKKMLVSVRLGFFFDGEMSHGKNPKAAKSRV